MLDLIVELFAAGVIFAVAIAVFFLLLNLRKASEEKAPINQRYKQARDCAEAERRFTTRRQIKTVQIKVERKAKKMLGVRRSSNTTSALANAETMSQDIEDKGVDSMLARASNRV